MRTTKLLTSLVLSLAVTGSSLGSAFAQSAAPAKPAPPPVPAAPAAPAPPAPPAAPAAPAAPAVPTLSDSLTGAAKADYESGKILFGDGDNAGALLKFKSAYEKSKDARLFWNMAACEKNLRHYARALGLLRQYLAEGGDKLTEQDKTEAKDLIKIMEPLTAKLKLNVSESGAEVFVDDESVGTTPVDALVVDIGSRKLRVRKDEFEEFTRDITVGETQMLVDVKLVKIVHEGRLNVRSTTDATIAIDGKVVGTGSWTGVLPSGGHNVAVSAPKMRAYQSEVYLQDKESRDLNVKLEPEASKGGLPAWLWIAGGAVIVGGATTAAVLIFNQPGKYEGPPGNLQPGVVQANTPFRF